ncbi:MAG: ATP-binding cassette domain-containing protein [Clostridia bacterium]|nr:ATP-binding cassette domain-containing protein [Clostridia bacterium]
MISIKNLTKVYKSKKGCPCTALNDVSFNLADKGMVFILGKSGSGKSTLLNILGGLDSATSGEIIMGGNSFSSFTESDYANYRNSFVGFVFQDFCLIESFTVRENIALSLEFNGNDNLALVEEIARKLGLEELLDRLPNELSGGQKQRVAIARAIIKNPSIILADEPTGNLDSKSSKQVLDTLKALSKDNLVVIVSHNPDDAENYGDRIIEIADGKIISDLTKNLNAQTNIQITSDEIIIPDTKNFKEEEIALLNSTLADSGYKIKQGERLFNQTIEPPISVVTPSALKNSGRRSFSKSLKTSFVFLKAKWGSFLFSVIVASAIIILFGLCQLFTSFDGKQTISEAVQQSNDKAKILKKGYIADELSNKIESSGLVSISDEDIQAFYDNGYQGKVYPLVNFDYPISRNSWKLHSCNTPETKKIYQDFYAQETLGVLVCDENFLTKIYGQNGKLNYLASSSSPEPYGMIITDFIADSIMFYHPEYKDYSSVLNYVRAVDRGYVNAVIDTGYKTRYAELIRQYEELVKTGTRLDIAKFKDSTEFLAFVEELNTYLNIAYSFNPNFLSDSVNPVCYYSIRLDSGEYSLNYDGISKTISPSDKAYYASYMKKDLKEGEILLTPTQYNEIFGTHITSPDDPNFVPGQKVTYTFYHKYYTGEKTPLYTKELTIVGLHQNFIILNNTDADAIRHFDKFRYALYFDNVSLASQIFETGEDRLFTINTPFYNAVITINEIVEIFKDLFFLIAIVLCFAGTIVLLTFGFNSIKKHNFEIGIMRALGGNILDITLIFLIQVLFAGVLISIISSIGLYVTTIIANNLLANSFVLLFDSVALSSLDILFFNPIALIIDLAIVVIITIISAITPIIAIKKVKPLQIIRNKE